MTYRCEYCTARTTGCTGLCQSCRSDKHHGAKAKERDDLDVSEVGSTGVWGVWDRRGNVLLDEFVGSYRAALIELGKIEKARAANAREERKEARTR